MQVAGFGISPKDFLLLVDVFFILAVLAASASSGNWNVFEHSYNILNPIFFDGANLDNPTCATMFSGFMTSQEDNAATPNSNFILDLVSSAGNILKSLLGFVIGILTFIYKGIVGCGLTGIRLILGWGIIISLIYPLYLLRHLRN